MKKLKIQLPNTLVLIFSILIVVTILTWILPGGRYQRIEKEGREYLDPDSYQKVESIGQGPMKLLMAPLNGFVSAAKVSVVTFFIINVSSSRTNSTFCPSSKSSSRLISAGTAICPLELTFPISIISLIFNKSH